MEKHRLFLARAEPEAEWTNLPQEPLLSLLFHPATSKMLLCHVDSFWVKRLTVI